MIAALFVWRGAIQDESTERRIVGGGSLNVGAVALTAASAATGGATIPLAALGGGSGAGADGEKMEKRDWKKESEDSHVFAISYQIVRRRKRGVIGSFAASIMGYDPPVDADRQYSQTGTASAVGLSANAEKEAPLELTADLPWVDVAEDATGANITTGKVRAGHQHVEFAACP